MRPLSPLEQQHRIDKFDRDARDFADGWCAEPSCLHRVECWRGRPLRSPYCPLHR